MGEFDALAAEIYKDKVRRARQTSPEEKLLAGQEMFDFACKLALAGIDQQHPGASETERREHLQRRLKISDLLQRKQAAGVAQ